MATAFLISAGSSWESSCSRMAISARSCFFMCSGIHVPWRRAGLLHPREMKELEYSLYAGDKEQGSGLRGQGQGSGSGALSDKAASSRVLGIAGEWAYTEVALDSPHAPHAADRIDRSCAGCAFSGRGQRLAGPFGEDA